MMEPARIHNGKTPNRIHYIPEWASKRGLRQKDIVRETGVEKSTVSRWFKGSLPQERHLLQLAALFHTDVPSLFRDPDDDWLTRQFANKTDEQREQAISILRALWADQKNTGTDG